MGMSNSEQPASQPLKIAGIEIPGAEQTPLVLALVAVIQRQAEEILSLRDEIQRMKGTTVRPKIAPSRMLQASSPSPQDKPAKRPGSAKLQKTKNLKIDQTIVLQPDDLPPGAELEGYRDFVVQELVIQSQTICYRRAVYRLADGSLRVGSRPADVDSHFGVGLRQYILMQVHQNHVTQGRLLEELQELGIDISAGQISNILLQGHEAFHAEKDELLPVAREISGYLHCDDTSARHKGKSAVCTHLGNELFASFSTTDSKSRLNFLQLLCQPQEQYRWCEEAGSSLAWLGGGKRLQQQMSEKDDGRWLGRKAWEQQLDQWEITKPDHRTLISEAALCGTLLTESWYDELGLISDDAPQFKIFGFIHGLCWVHGERKIDRLIPLTAAHRRAKEQAQTKFWEIYQRLKKYRTKPTPRRRQAIESRFDSLGQTRTGYPDLNAALGLLHAKRDQFLAVLNYPHLPLHNNLSENDIREYARLRKISAGTRSDLGRRCRDTFISLKKTCRKLGVSFRAYLHDRLTKANRIPPLTDLMRAKAKQNSPPHIKPLTC
jgi:Transposase IS66 family